VTRLSRCAVGDGDDVAAVLIEQFGERRAEVLVVVREEHGRRVYAVGV